MEDGRDEIEFLTRTNADLASQNDRLSKDLEVCRAKLEFAEGAAEEVVGMTSSLQATLSYLQKDVSEGEAMIAKLEFKEEVSRGSINDLQTSLRSNWPRRVLNCKPCWMPLA